MFSLLPFLLKSILYIPISLNLFGLQWKCVPNPGAIEIRSRIQKLETIATLKELELFPLTILEFRKPQLPNRQYCSMEVQETFQYMLAA